MSCENNFSYLPSSNTDTGSDIPSSPNMFVRSATTTDCTKIGHIQAQAMVDQITVIIAPDINQTIPFEDKLAQIPANMRQQFIPEVVSATWQAQLENLPANADVLVAIQHDQTGNEEIAGMASAMLDGTDYEITTLVICPTATNRGHASRLLSALSQRAQHYKATRFRTWIVQGDEARIRFFSACGFAPQGSTANLPLPSGDLTIHCWVANL